MTSVLETRYRALLRILPADYRAAWEDEMVATFLQGMATDDEDEAEYLAEFGRPPWSEVASVVGLAVRLRVPVVRRYIGGTAAAPRHRAVGDAVRIVALLGLVTNAARAVVGLAMQLWLADRVPGLPPPPEEWGAGAALARPWPTMLVLLGFTALPAYLALVAGRWSAARLLAAVSAGSVLLAAATDVVAGDPFRLTRILMLLIDGVLLAALWAFHGSAPPIRRRPWLIALPVAVAVAAGTLIGTNLAGPRVWQILDWPALCSVPVAAGLAIHLARPGRGAAWPLAMTWLAAMVLGQRLLTLAEFAGNVPPAQSHAVLVAGAIEIGVVAALGLPVALRARRALRRLPAPDPPAHAALAPEG
jgi:hypothetical protein